MRHINAKKDVFISAVSLDSSLYLVLIIANDL